jgi:hypothetical protein
MPYWDGQFAETITLSSNADNGLPYKIKLNTWLYAGGTQMMLPLDISFVLSETDKISKERGTGFVYLVEESSDSQGLMSFEVTFLYLTDAYIRGKYANVIMTHMIFPEGSDVYNEHGITVFNFFPPNTSMNEIMVGSDRTQWTLTGTDTIETIDGYVLCDVYEENLGYRTMIYIGQENGVMYRLTSEGQGFGREVRLMEHISPSDGTGMFDDPYIEGDLKIGQTLIFDLVSIHTETPIDGMRTGETLTATVIGENGSYYVLLLSFEWEYDLGNRNGTSVLFMHKQTGELLFSSYLGDDSVTYDDVTIPLQKWEWASGLPYDEGQYNERIAISVAADGIPHKVTLGLWALKEDPGYMEASFILSTITKETSEVRGTGLVYSLNGDSENGHISTETTILYVADGIYRGDTIKIMLVNWTFLPDSAWSFEHGFKAFVPCPPDKGLNDVAHEFMALGNWTLKGTETIDTIDGPVLCDVYEEITLLDYRLMHIGQENGIIYILKEIFDGYERETVLIRHLFP